MWVRRSRSAISSVVTLLLSQAVCSSLNSKSYIPVCTMKFHKKARTQIYPRSHNRIERFFVPDGKVEWTEKWDEYKPTSFTSESILNQPWADPEISDPQFKPKWNLLDGIVNRVSHTGAYGIVDSYPRNPIGRTGLIGRGCLGRWGPNHAVDPIVTRWKRDSNNTLVTDPNTNLPILQFVAILRSDSREWAIPGGMVDPGEKISITLRREFGEEALNSLEMSPKEKKETQAMLDEFFKGGIEMYKGYVDDPRNTDNAWMETVAVNFHDGSGDSVGKFPLRAGDDAVGVRWMDLSSCLELYASHVDFLQATSKHHKAHW